MAVVNRVTVYPATPQRWHDLVEVFGRRGDDPGWCWCQRFVRTETERRGADNRAALCAEITSAATPPGLIAYVGERPAGWTRVGPRASLSAIRANRSLARVIKGDGTATWWVACFAVAPGCRRTGVAAALLEAAVDFARGQGAEAVEGHPVDVAGLHTEAVSGSALFTGTKSLFEAAGFVEVARTYPTRPVMRRSL